MLHVRSRDHQDDFGDDLHNHDHRHDHPDGASVELNRAGWLPAAQRFGLAAALLVGAGAAASAVMVSAGEAIVVTQFGAVTRVITEPGLAWKAPAPMQMATPVDLRLRTTSTGLQDVGTRDGLRILVQAYAAWAVPKDEKAILQYLRAVRNDPDEAARQLRSFVGSALQVTASDFDLADLVNADPSRLRLSEFEARLRQQVEGQVRSTYGIAIAEIGVERLTLPETTLNATVARMRSERETIAVQRTAEGQRRAAEIRADAQRDSRIAIAAATVKAADIEATARRDAAGIYAKAYQSDPRLYLLLRSLDTLAQVTGPNTRILLRADAAPFDLLVQGPPRDEGAAPGPATAASRAPGP
jgi:modulator of FtsH protease HflC